MELDETSTYLLGLIAGAMLLSVLLRPSPPLTHPILLGRQAEPSAVHKPGESVIWTNSLASTGMLVVRPGNNIKALRDVVAAAKPEFRAKIADLAGKLQSLAIKLQANAMQPQVVALACDEATNLHLAFACSLVPGLLPFVLPQQQDAHSSLLAKQQSAAMITPSSNPEPSDLLVCSPDLQDFEASSVDTSAVISVDAPAVLASAWHDGEWSVISLTNLNMTAAIHNLCQVVVSQTGQRMSEADDVLSSFPLASPLGFALAATAVYLKARFQFAQTATLSSIVHLQPTVLFCSAPEGSSLADTLQEQFTVWPLAKLVLSSKKASLQAGHISCTSWFDFFPLNSFRSEQHISSLRAIVVLDDAFRGIARTKLDTLRAILSCPVLQGSMHALQPVPLTVSQMHDFQDSLPDEQASSLGPPSSNVELKLVSLKEGKVLAGELRCRGPAILFAKGSRQDEQWWDAGRQARILTNGTVVGAL